MCLPGLGTIHPAQKTGTPIPDTGFFTRIKGLMIERLVHGWRAGAGGADGAALREALLSEGLLYA